MIRRAARGPTLPPVSEPAAERVGLFGGTFDPPHVGHLTTALEVAHALDLHRMVLVVAGDPWQKTEMAPVTPAAHRLEMTRALAEGCDVLEVSRMEIDRGGPSYTADTLEALALERPDDERFLVVGSDAAAGLPTWDRPDVVRMLATVVVVDRKGREGGRPPAGWTHRVVQVPGLEVSSSDVRRRVREGAPIRGLVPAAVADVIEVEALYGVPR